MGFRKLVLVLGGVLGMRGFAKKLLILGVVFATVLVEVNALALAYLNEILIP